MTATGPAGGSLIVYTTGVAKVIETYLKIPTAPQACSSSLEACTVMLKGEAQLAGISGAEMLYGTLNKAPLPSNANTILRGILFGEYKSDAQWVVRVDSGINSIADLKGKKVMCSRPGQALFEDNWRATLEAYGLKETDIVAMPALASADQAQALKEGRVDAVFLQGFIPVPQLLEVSMSVPLKVLSLDDKAISHIISKCPWLIPQTAPAGGYKGQDKDAKITTALAPITARKDLPDDLVYAIAKAVDEHIADLQAVHQSFKSWNIKGLANNPYGPYHAGAFRYFNEKGILSQDSVNKHKQYLSQIGQSS
jgi:TRAP transporter TAXI family solute receptor